MASDRTRIDEIVDGVYRISTWQEPYGITFNQFLIADERPALIHTCGALCQPLPLPAEAAKVRTGPLRSRKTSIRAWVTRMVQA